MRGETLAQHLFRTPLLAAIIVALLSSAMPAIATEGTSGEPVLVKRVQADGTARWERVSNAQMRALVSRTPGVIIAVSEDAVVTQLAAPNDPRYSEQWNFQQIQAEAAWMHATGFGVVVAVIDSGVTPGPDLACRTFVAPYNAISGALTLSAVADGSGHGTHVTGTVAQCTNNGIGVAGLAHGAVIMPIKVLDDSGEGWAGWLANGIAHAVENGADIINLSLAIVCDDEDGPDCISVAVEIEIDAAVAAGVVVVVAAGNESSGTVSYPASHPKVIAVGATNSARERAEYSNAGSALDVMAPGGDAVDRDSSGDNDVIWQESFNDSGVSSIIGMSGTSMAAPHVAATVAMMKERNPTWTPLRHRCVLQETARDIDVPGFDVGTGWGEIDPAGAITHRGEAWTDVNGGWYEAAADFVADAGIVVGYDDCTFAPDAQISRSESVTMLVRTVGLAPVVAPTGMFSDVPADSWSAPFIEAAANAGWVMGYPDGTFAPGGLMSRSELAAIVTRAFGYTSSDIVESPFSDVTAGDWFYDEVLAAWAGGAVDGYPDGSFLPGALITRAETAQVFFNINA